MKDSTILISMSNVPVRGVDIVVVKGKSYRMFHVHPSASLLLVDAIVTSCGLV